MEVKYLDLPQQFADPQLSRSLEALFRTCQFVLGPQVAQFEAQFAQLCGTRFAVGVNSGTDALFLALKALGVGRGDEVITVANSFVATAGAIVAAEATPVFVDVGPDYNMNPALLEDAITARTKCIIPVHLTGNPADMEKILEVARRRRLPVVEDAAQAVGASIAGRAVGSFGEVGCFSLHPLKNLNVAGDGGVMTTDSPDLAPRFLQMRNHGLKNRDEIDFFGHNSRLDTIQAIIATHHLQKLEETTQQRIRNANRYDAFLTGLEDRVILPPRDPQVKQVFHTYVIQVEQREQLGGYLARHGVETKIHYPLPIHLQAPCRRMGWKIGDLPETERQARRILTLPIHQFLTEAQIAYVAETIKNFFRRQ